MVNELIGLAILAIVLVLAAYYFFGTKNPRRIQLGVAVVVVCLLGAAIGLVVLFPTHMEPPKTIWDFWEQTQNQPLALQYGIVGAGIGMLASLLSLITIGRLFLRTPKPPITGQSNDPPT